MMEGEDSDSADDRAFNNKSVWARISVVFAGPLFNFIMAFIFSFIIIMSIGYDEAKLSDVLEGYSADEAGMQAGDVIVKMDNYNIHFYKEISLYSTIHYGESVEVTYLRDGEKRTTTLVPVFDEESQRYLYGFVGTGQYTKANVGTALVNSLYEDCLLTPYRHLP